MNSTIIMFCISVLITTFVLVGCWRCPLSNCLVYPLSLKLWSHQIEVSARSVQIKAGSDFHVTCDGSCVGSETDPRLRWYGPDKHWISYQGSHNRIYEEKSLSRRYLKLHLKKARSSDSGLYTCRGWLGSGVGWDTTTLRINVVEENTPTLVPTTEAVVVPSTEPLTEPECVSPKFRCGSGECFDRHYRCDSFPDCRDTSDESNCASLICTEDLVACTDGFGCVPIEQICDGVQQCRDASDENPDVCRSQ